MIQPRVRAVLDRRILINYRVDPDVVMTLIPASFRPVVVGSSAIAGICLIRLRQIRPAGLPPATGLTTENAAHRFAVQWDTPGGPATGVFVPRRDTDSLLTTLIGGKLFPGWHHRASFVVAEKAGRLVVELTSHDGQCQIRVAARPADRVMPGSVFADVDQASQFFRAAPVGYSARPRGEALDAVELGIHGWNMLPLTVDRAASSYFDDPGRFPPGSVELDSAFLMRGLDTTWSACPPLPVAPAGFQRTATPS